MVEFNDWEPHYLRILKAFHYDRSEDEECARILDELLPTPRLTQRELSDIIHGQVVYIFGAHDRVEQDSADIKERTISGIFIAADGACTAMREQGLRPHLIVTDLDGRLEDLRYWNRLGVPMIILAHGDNRDRIQELAPDFKRSVATTQSIPEGNLMNFGGFTDGDRCVFIADHFAATRIVLCGFDYTTVGKYSFTTSSETKLMKLRWAKQFISEFEVEYY